MQVWYQVLKVNLGSYTCRGVEPPEPGGLAHVKVGLLWGFVTFLSAFGHPPSSELPVVYSRVPMSTAPLAFGLAFHLPTLYPL